MFMNPTADEHLGCFQFEAIQMNVQLHMILVYMCTQFICIHT